MYNIKIESLRNSFHFIFSHRRLRSNAIRSALICYSKMPTRWRRNGRREEVKWSIFWFDYDLSSYEMWQLRPANKWHSQISRIDIHFFFSKKATTSFIGPYRPKPRLEWMSFFSARISGLCRRKFQSLIIVTHRTTNISHHTHRLWPLPIIVWAHHLLATALTPLSCCCCR